MNVKEAIEIAKAYIRDIYADEQVSNVGLEETEFDDLSQRWLITIGLSRPWNMPRTRARELIEKMEGVSSLKRAYKTVTIDQRGEVISMKNRAVEHAE